MNILNKSLSMFVGGLMFKGVTYTMCYFGARPHCSCPSLHNVVIDSLIMSSNKIKSNQFTILKCSYIQMMYFLTMTKYIILGIIC